MFVFYLYYNMQFHTSCNVLGRQIPFAYLHIRGDNARSIILITRPPQFETPWRDCKGWCWWTRVEHKGQVGWKEKSKIRGYQVFGMRDAQAIIKGRIGYIIGCVYYRSEDFELKGLDTLDVKKHGGTTEVWTVCSDESQESFDSLFSVERLEFRIISLNNFNFNCWSPIESKLFPNPKNFARSELRQKKSSCRDYSYPICVQKCFISFNIYLCSLCKFLRTTQTTQENISFRY